MSSESTNPVPADETPVAAAKGGKAESREPDTAKRVYLVSYPKLIFMYPTFIASVIAGLVTWIAGPGRTSEVATLAFLTIFTLNLSVLTFDFPRTTSLTLFFFVAMVGMGSFLLFTFKPDLLPVVGAIVAALQPYANEQFYFLFAGILLAFYAAMMVAVRFDYWEVRNNELLHHHGLLSDLKRFPAPNLRVDKEINDVFEYLLLGSGRLILHARSESRAIVLDNVLFINRKEQILTRMLGALKVSVRDEED